jgi:hypothetical protein
MPTASATSIRQGRALQSGHDGGTDGFADTLDPKHGNKLGIIDIQRQYNMVAPRSPRAVR